MDAVRAEDASSQRLHFFHEVHPGSFIGELAAFFVQPRSAGAVTEGVVVCHTLLRDDVLRIAAEFTEDRKHICEGLMSLPQLKGQTVSWDHGVSHFVASSVKGIQREGEMSAIRSQLKDVTASLAAVVKRLDAIDQ